MKKQCIVGQISDNARKILTDDGYEINLIEPNYDVDERLRYHADVSVFIDDNEFFCHKSQVILAQKFKSMDYNIHIVNDEFGKTYPLDCRLNVVRIGNIFLCNEKAVSREVLEYEKSKGVKIVNVRQGYVKCSTVAKTANGEGKSAFILTDDEPNARRYYQTDEQSNSVGEGKSAFILTDDEPNARRNYQTDGQSNSVGEGKSAFILTDDESIYLTCVENGIDALKIDKGFVKLNGFDYGFIGGATAITQNRIYFNGSLDFLPNKEKIEKFLSSRGCEAVSLSDDKILDIGSIFLLG